jgi:hypothetical protein
MPNYCSIITYQTALKWLKDKKNREAASREGTA